MTSTATTTSFTLTAITDDSIKKVHLGAKEREAGKTWCGVQLLVPGDKRFGGRYKDIVWEEILTDDGGPDLEAVTCGACKRSAPWKAYEAAPDGEGMVYTPAAPKPKADPKPRAAAKPKATAKAGTISANEAQEMANRAADAGAAKAAAPSKRKSAATRKAEAAAADAARLAGMSGSSVIEPDPETGLPRIKPEVQAKADAVAAKLVADADAEAAALVAADEQAAYEADQAAQQDQAVASVTDIKAKKGAK